MDTQRVQDSVYRGLGRAGRVVGDWCEVFRPDGPMLPMAPRCRVLRMPAAFSAPDGRFARPVGHGQVYWHGVFDAAYTRVGDYIRRGDGAVWFIAAQQALLPVLCVRASRVVEVRRTTAPERPGLAPYGGTASGAETVLRGWPAGMVAAGGMLLPALRGVVLRAGDLVRDDLGRDGVIAQVELSEAGWRLQVGK